MDIKLQSNEDFTINTKSGKLIEFPDKHGKVVLSDAGGKIVPILEKTYASYTVSADDQNKGFIYFMNIIPTSDKFFEPWHIKYRLYVNTTEKYTQGFYDCYISVAGTTLTYASWNEFYSGSYRPIYNHTIAYYNSEAKYNNRSTYPIKIGVRVQSSRSVTTLARTYKIEIYEIDGCTVTFNDTPQTYDSFYNADYYGSHSEPSATSTGLAETGDISYPNYYDYYYYNGYRLSNANAPLYRYKIVGFDEKMRVIPFNITDQQNGTLIQKTPCSLGFTVSNGMAYYNSATTISSTTQAFGAGTLYWDTSINTSYCTYNFNTVIDNSSTNSFHSNVYYCGSYDPLTDKFYLDTSTTTSWYLSVSNDANDSTWKQSFVEGKYYWLVGHSCENNGYFNFLPYHPLYYFDGDKLIPEIVLMQNKPVVVYETDGTTGLLGLQSNISDSPAWQLTGLNLSPFKRIKIYTKCSQKNGITPSASTTSAMVLEMTLDSRAGGPYSGHFVGSVVSQNPNDANRLATLTCAVSADKTSFAVLRMNTLYGTAATSNNDVNGYVFLIEGYYN